MNIFKITSTSNNSEITDAYHYGGFTISQLTKLTGKNSNELIEIIEQGIIDEELADISRRHEANNILKNYGLI